VLVIAAPGQGAQSPGFLTSWLESADFAAHLGRLAAAADLDLVHFGTEADADTIRDTAIAQPLLVAAAIAAAAQIEPDAFGGADAVTGHSVGELAAAAGAGVVTDEDAMRLVRERGKAMAEAAAVTATSMTAVLGGDRTEVLATLEKHGLTPANDNGPGQIVAAGTTEQLAALEADPPARARLIPLSVAGAFHTEHMAPAVSRLEALAATLTPADPITTIVSNRDGTAVATGPEVLERLVSQVSSPVRWDLCMNTLLESGVTGLLELPPAGTLTGIARRAMKGVETFALKTPDQLDEAREFCARHRADVPVAEGDA
jgi:[acyl-carrier-protein] S-malonyltransferase